MEAAAQPALAYQERARFDAKWLIIAACVALTLYLGVVPLGFLVWQSFFTPQRRGQGRRVHLRQLPGGVRLFGHLGSSSGTR